MGSSLEAGVANGRTTGAGTAVASATLTHSLDGAPPTTLVEQLEVATSLWGKFIGLMGRRTLPAGHGLWLAGTNGIHMMFMRFPIDAVFLGKSGQDGTRTVVGVKPRLRRWIGVVWYVRGADSVIELPAGTIADACVEVGDTIRLNGVG